MSDKPETQPQEPTPRPPRQPDTSLITHIEKGGDSGDESRSDDSSD